MLTEEQVQALLVCRASLYAKASEPERDILAGQLKALLAVLYDGTPPPVACLADVVQWSGIPHVILDRVLVWDRDWLLAHGFTVQEDGNLTHPQFAVEW